MRKFEKRYAARPVPLPAVFTDSAAFPAAGEQMALSRAPGRKTTRAMLGDDTAGRLQRSSMTGGCWICVPLVVVGRGGS